MMGTENKEREVEKVQCILEMEVNTRDIGKMI